MALQRNASQVGATSGNVANASGVATIPAVVGQKAWITGFEITGSGATAGLPVTVTVTGLGVAGGTLTYTYSASVGVLVANQPLSVEFPEPLPASANNTSIVVTCPALGLGNTNNTVVAHGFYTQFE